jgi:hypothetical protein
LLTVLEGGKSTTEELASGEGLLVASFYGRSWKGMTESKRASKLQFYNGPLRVTGLRVQPLWPPATTSIKFQYESWSTVASRFYMKNRCTSNKAVSPNTSIRHFTTSRRMPMEHCIISTGILYQ